MMFPAINLHLWMMFPSKPPFIDDFPIRSSIYRGFPRISQLAMFDYQRVMGGPWEQHGNHGCDTLRVYRADGGTSWVIQKKTHPQFVAHEIQDTPTWNKVISWPPNGWCLDVLLRRTACTWCFFQKLPWYTQDNSSCLLRNNLILADQSLEFQDE